MFKQMETTQCAATENAMSQAEVRRISQYFEEMVASRPGGCRLPPFNLIFDEADPGRFRNYAIPSAGTDATAEDLSKLIAEFRRRDRTPRFEFIPELAPQLGVLLRRGGFVEEGVLPLMAYRGGAFDFTSSEISTCFATSRSALSEAAQIQHAAFGDGAIVQADVDRLLRLVDEGGLVALARAKSGKAVGSGLVTRPFAGVAELAGLGVSQEHRRRGVGRQVANFLARTSQAQDVSLLFLTAAGDDEARMYEAIGFETIGACLHAHLPPLPSPRRQQNATRCSGHPDNASDEHSMLSASQADLMGMDQ
ncbi:GNAT family N-acetyltransferase [Mesorhizobium loti]|uniref:Uncharacterized protein n=2 Tax=Rhizobium loti TaxID=381 RepID=A0A6M7U1S4_RHILI|nr:hypothetical protein A8145_21620 [Mesorhizobium loti]QKC71321.1 GNAT family N-acetyltransferase [Mesorhizobium loti]